MPVHDMWVKIVDGIFSLGLLTNSTLFIPQAWRIFKKKHADDLSLTTFVGFCLIQGAAISYGYMHNDSIMVFGYSCSFITCGTVTGLSIYYRLKKRMSNIGRSD